MARVGWGFHTARVEPVAVTRHYRSADCRRAARSIRLNAWYFYVVLAAMRGSWPGQRVAMRAPLARFLPNWYTFTIMEVSTVKAKLGPATLAKKQDNSTRIRQDEQEMLRPQDCPTPKSIHCSAGLTAA